MRTYNSNHTIDINHNPPVSFYSDDSPFHSFKNTTDNLSPGSQQLFQI